MMLCWKSALIDWLTKKRWYLAGAAYELLAHFTVVGEESLVALCAVWAFVLQDVLMPIQGILTLCTVVGLDHLDSDFLCQSSALSLKQWHKDNEIIELCTRSISIWNLKIGPDICNWREDVFLLHDHLGITWSSKLHHASTTVYQVQNAFSQRFLET